MYNGFTNTMTMSEYCNLKQQVVVAFGSKDIHNELLANVKNIFKADINSLRRFEEIETIGKLLKTLELRGILSEDNIHPLKEIAKAIGSTDLLMKITKYEDSYVRREYSNLYISDKTNISSTETNEGGISKNKRERIRKTVIEEIGSFWRDLARSLRVRECVIDEIEFSCNTLATKAMKIMEYYEASPMYDPQNWYFILCEALEKIHRKDILRSIRKIMMMNV